MKKLVNKKGFTLIEMLIVVAIVGILVAIAVPTMSSSLDKANAAADDANLRTAKSQFAAAVADPDVEDPAEKAVYNPETGKFVAANEKNDDCKGQCKHHEGSYITVIKESTTVGTGENAVTTTEYVVKWANAEGVALPDADQECSATAYTPAP